MESDYIFDTDSKDYLALWNFTKQVADGMHNVISCERIGIAVIGLEVAHAHIHLVPINAVEDINFERQKLTLTDIELEEIATSIRLAI